MTNGELEAYARKQFPGITQRIVDWRPASDMYIEDLVMFVAYRGKQYAKFPNGVLFTLENGDHVIYVKHLTKPEQAALKAANEAHLLSIDEIKPEKVYWRQQRQVDTPFPVAFMGDNGVMMTDYAGDVVLKNKYGVTWVLWSEKPTKSQMKFVKWKDK